MQGVYILVLELLDDVCLKIGRLGYVCLYKGIYGYVGSAKGSGGIEARIRHHMNKSKRRVWWHIDYITTHSKSAIRYAVCARTLDVGEEDIASSILKSSCWNMAVKGFGSTDRKSITHLFRCVCELCACTNELLNVLAELGLRPEVITPEHSVT